MYPNPQGLERREPGPRVRWGGAALAVLLLAGTAWAHDADVIYVLVTEGADGGLEELVTLTAGTLSQLAPIDADKDGALSQADLDERADAIGAGVWDQMPVQSEAEGPLGASACLRTSPIAKLREGYVELQASFACAAGPLSQDFRILRVLSSNYRVVLGRQVEGERGGAFAQGNVQRLSLRPVPRAAPASPWLTLAAGSLSLLGSLDVVLVWLLSILVASSAAQAGARTAALAVGFPSAAWALAATDRAPPELLGAAVVAVVGVASGLWVLSGKHASGKWPVLAIGVLSVGDALRGSAAPALVFQAGRLAALVTLALALAPVARAIGRTPRLERSARVAVAVAALAALGFSLVQAVRAF